MRIAMIGAGSVAVTTARYLIDRGHDVILIDNDRSRIEEVNDRLDCGFLHGDGSSPDLLREVGPESTDFLFCLSDSDQENIIASLVGRSLGFKHVIPKIENEAYEQVCVEVGLQHTILPDRTIARNLADMVEGQTMLELSTMIRGDVRFFSYFVREEDAGKLCEQSYPKRTRPICIYRNDDFIVPDDDTQMKEGDEVVLITERSAIEGLRKRWDQHSEDQSE